ncbi:fibronectin type III domain-containing protein, partial [Dactylosporangium salmoneum]|uniref:fibronectin type III domain-containing protein n=1 Tax=Dactylosporangium salmoneum TaxID=53361 RepID=UPI0031D194FE
AAGEAGLNGVPASPTTTSTTPAAAAPPASGSPRPAAGVPAPPAALKAIPASAAAIRLEWTDNSDNETGFTVINGVTSRDVAANATTYTWTGLAPEQYMCFKVRAFNAAGPSPYFPAAQESWVCATSQKGTGPAAPSNLTAEAVSPTAIRLQWTDNSDNETGFTVINGSASRNAGANATAYTWDGLSPGTYMCFKVRAVNAAGVSPYTPSAQESWACTTTPAAGGSR